MTKKKTKRSVFSSLRNNFIAGVVVLIPIGITLYLTLFIIKISSKILPKEINPNYYLPYNIPGLEILISIIIITFVGWLSLSFLGKKLFDFCVKQKNENFQIIYFINFSNSNKFILSRRL